MGEYVPAKAGLFSPPTPETVKILNAFPEILEKVWPLKAAHKKSLPRDIRDLSRALTAERGNLDRPYWMKPNFISAYLYYFLPWNIIRLTRLLGSLPFPDPTSDNPLLIDAGCGPLTFPISLWLARPELRRKPLTALCVDTAKRPAELGIEIFKNVCASADAPPWQAFAIRGSLRNLGFRVRAFTQSRPSTLWLLSAVNVLNEALGNADERPPKEGGEEEENQIAKILENLLPANTNVGENFGVLLVEPGTRLGGDAIMKARTWFLEAGMNVVSPCVSQKACPLSKRGQSSSYSASWCHFSFETGAPAWLKKLTREAGFERRELSLSALLVEAVERAEDQNIARVISGPFRAPGLYGQCRYCCSGDGLLILADAADLRRGDTARFTRGKENNRDAKSGALIMTRKREKRERSDRGVTKKEDRR